MFDLTPILAKLPYQDPSMFQRAEGNVTVVDRHPGYGKTTGLLKSFTQTGQYLVVVPELSEVARVLQDTTAHGVQFYEPLSTSVKREDRTGSPFDFLHNTKAEAILDLIEAGHNVVTTHALFSEIGNLAKEGLLIDVDVYVDEVLDVAEVRTDITKVNRRRGDGSWRELYINKLGLVTVCPDIGRIDVTDEWRENHEAYAGNISEAMFAAAEAGRLFTDVEGLSNEIIVAELPVALLKLSKSLTVFTYRYEGSYMAAYMSKHGIAVTHDRDEEADVRFRALAKELVTIDPMEGLKGMPLGYTAQTRAITNTAKANLVRAEIRKLVRSGGLKGVNRSDMMLTCLKDGWITARGGAGKFALKTDLFKDANWVANTTRGTNKYANCSHLIYLWEQNHNANTARFLNCDSKKQQDLYAVSELIQWVYRSRVRKGKPVTLYLPSQRMRDLWQRWLDGDI